MKINDGRRVLACSIVGALMIGPIETSLADIGPPVTIKMQANAAVATAGQEYIGAFEINLYELGVLSDFRIEGTGWRVKSSTLPTEPVRADVGTIRVTFRAIPTDADKPVGLSFRYNGRYVRAVFDVGPAHARWLTPIPNTSGLRSGQAAEPNDSEQPTSNKAGDGTIPIRAVGRIVYHRPGIDRSEPPDGDFDDPEDTPPATVGGDSLRVHLQDVDFLNEQTIWSGSTDEQGYFDTGVVMWLDCDIFPLECDTPDLLLRVATFSSSTVAVVDTNIDTYQFEVPEMEDFEGDFHDYGWLSPPANFMPALHIHSNVVRATRFVVEDAASQSEIVPVIWPDDSRGDAAWFTPGEDSIRISTGRQWRTDIIIHEFGHHHMHLFYNPLPAVDYCDADSDCDPDPPNDCGHCIWCGENEAVAWFEGWPNWLADVVTRNYPDRYMFDDGSPFKALYTLSQESPNTCDGFYNNPETTEGFVGALLRDIEDATQDDHDDDPGPVVAERDGVFDLMCLGVNEIFSAMEAGQPTTVGEFITEFQTRNPQHLGDFWPTAFNVGGSAYVASFPPDIDPPGAVAIMKSPSHPLGEGGSLPCITFEFDPAPDDVTGANTYSYILTDNPAGEEPNEVPNAVRPAGDCKVQGIVPAWDIGTWYVSIKAQDNEGRWSGEHFTSFPMEVIDCNNTGQLDICDISCSHKGIPGLCLFGITPCNNLAECVETSEDCNGNAIPDECDISSGDSQDCDVNGVPDECQEIKHWASEIDPPEGYDWALSSNWMEEEIPVLLDTVCAPEDSYGPTVIFDEDDITLTSLACHLNFIMAGAVFPAQSPKPDLDLNESSFVAGDFQMEGASTLTVNDRLRIDGKFYWMDGQIRGTGVTELNDGVRLTRDSVELISGTLNIFAGESFSNGPRIVLSGGADVTIGEQATYRYEGDSHIFNGGTVPIAVRGTLIRSAGDGTASVFTPVDNTGTIRTQTGELVLWSGGTHSGDLLGDPGAKLMLRGTHELLGGSRVVVDSLKLDSSNGGNIRGSVNISDTLECNAGTWTFQPEANIINYGRHLIAMVGTHRFLAPTDASIDFETVTVGPASEGSESLYFDTSQPVNVGDFDLIKGSLYGNSPINVSGTFSWTNGSIFAGGTITANGPVVVNATSSSRTLYRTLNITDQAVVRSGFGIGGSGSVNILDSVVFNMQFNSGTIGSRTINNFGTVLRSSGSGEISLSAALNNSSLVHNQTGTLNLSGGGTHTGDLLSAPGTILKISGSGHNFESSSTTTTPILELGASSSSFHGSLNIADTLMSTSGSWTFASDANIINYGDHLSVIKSTLHFESPTDRAVNFDTVEIGPNFNSASVHFDTGQPFNVNTFVLNDKGNIDGSSPINIAIQFTWSNGNISSGGPIRSDGNMTVNPISSARTLRRPLNNYGTMTVRGPFSLSPSGPINNKPGAAIDLQYENSSMGISGVINNEGMMIKTTSAGTAGLPNVVNTGTIDVQVGAISFHTTYVGLTQTAGETILNDTSIEMFANNKPFDLQGGVLRGNGAVIGELDNSGGTVTPGFSVGEILVDDFTQGTNGVLEMEIGGSNSGEYDVLTVTNVATLAGELRVTDIDEFVPQPGDSLVILTASAVVGTFGTQAVPDHYEVVYSATAVTLQRSGPSPDLNGDGVLDLKDYALFQSCYGGADQAPAASCAIKVNADLDADGDVDLDDYNILFVAITQ